MFKTEIYRLLSKKTGLAAMLVAMLFILYFTLGNTVWGEGVIDGGEGGVHMGKVWTSCKL